MIGRRGKSLGPRVAELASDLDPASPKCMSSVSEIALLVSCSASARAAVAAGEIEDKLLTVLSRSSDASIQCWCMSILSNLATDPASRERQAGAVPAVCVLLNSHDAQVQHAAALHLARLSHSDFLRAAISKAGGLNSLYKLEAKPAPVRAAIAGGMGMAPLPSIKSKGKLGLLQQESQQYARWTLRTARGGNYKASFTPKTEEELRLDAAATHVQKHARAKPERLTVQAEIKGRRDATTAIQKTYRGKHDREAVSARRADAAAARGVSFGEPAAVGGGPEEAGVCVTGSRRVQMSLALTSTTEDVLLPLDLGAISARPGASSARRSARRGEAPVMLDVPLACSDGTYMLRIPLGGGGGAEADDGCDGGGEGFDEATGVLSLALMGGVALELPLMTTMGGGGGGVGGAATATAADAQGVVAEEAKAVVARVIACATQMVVDKFIRS